MSVGVRTGRAAHLKFLAPAFAGVIQAAGVSVRVGQSDGQAELGRAEQGRAEQTRLI